MGILQLLGPDQSTVLWDFDDATGAANPSTVITNLAAGVDMGDDRARAEGLPISSDGRRSQRLATSSEAGRVDPVGSLLGSEALELQLVDEALAAERTVVQVILRGPGCLLVPVHRDVVHCEAGVGL